MKKEIGHSNSNRWLLSGKADLLVLLAPVWLVWIVFFSNAEFFQGVALPTWAWVVFILGIDVSHVWSSLFRTYGVKDEFNAHRTLFILAPIILLALSITVLSFSVLWFWRIMAYIAVFHFIKQQYGFAALYRFKSETPHKRFLSDKTVVYIATVYPVIFWHFNSLATFNWFASNDFFPLHQFLEMSLFITLFKWLNLVYWLIMAAWVIQEIRLYRKANVSPGKILWVLTTAVNWWFGIVYFNSDVIFSVSNVVAHGIPYIALIYFYRVRKQEIKTAQPLKINKRLRWIIVLLGTILVAALIEEYFWDMLVNRQYPEFFEAIYPYHWQQVTHHWGMLIAIAILALPQQVHYIIDGFIWKMNAKNKYLKPIFKPEHGS